MRRWIVIVVLTSYAVATHAHGQVPAPTPPMPTIKWPAVLPAIMPAPGAVAKITGDMLYVVETDNPMLLLASPQGIVSITQDAGPLRIRGLFIDGKGKTETRTYKAKFVFVVEAAATGRVELIAVPLTAKSESDVDRKTIDVETGQAPKPPPGPSPVDAFTAAVQTGYAMDGKPALDAVKLAAIYKLSKKTVDDPALKTIQDVFSKMHAAAELVVPSPILHETRLAVKAEEDTVFGKTDIPLTTELRAKIWAQHQRIQAALETLK